MSSKLSHAFEQDYRIIAQLGQGGMARVLLAVRRGPGGFRKLFVIKQLRPDLRDDWFVEMFLDEARLAALLSHPNVVQAYEVGQSADDCYLSMEYLEGQTLGRLVRRVTREQFPVALHVHVLAEVLAGLHYAHQLKDLQGAPLGVVHRDVSPGNVFLTYDGQVKLLDFGIAKAAGASVETQVGTLKGKLAYMAPEQASHAKLDRRADIFAVGVMLWEALTGRSFVPRREDDALTLHRRLRGEWTPIERIHPDVDPKLAQTCRRALALDPADRYETAEELRDALLEYLEQQPERPTREQVGAVVSARFARERAELDAKIAAKIAAGGTSDETLVANTLTGLSRQTILASSTATRVVGTPETISTSRWGRFQRAAAVVCGGVCLGGVVAWLVDVGFAGLQAEPPVQVAAASDDTAEPVKLAGIHADISNKADVASVIETLRLSVQASPDDAIIELDGQVFPSNPIQQTLPRDLELHRLVVRKEGYQPAERWISFDRDIDLELVLRELPSSNGGPRRRPARETGKNLRVSLANKAKPPGGDGSLSKKSAGALRDMADQPAEKPVAVGDVLVAPKQKSTRPIDENNPYQ